MIEYALMVAGSFVSVFFLLKRQKQRPEPLKNSEKVAVEINTATALESLHIYLPPPHFIKNMSAAVDKERSGLAALWSYEKNVFPVLWDKMTDTQRKQLLVSLLEELVRSIGVYSDTDKLLAILCPRLKEDLLLARNVSTDEASPQEQGAPAELLTFLHAAQQGKMEIKPYCLPLLLLSVQKEDREVDPNREVQDTDGVLAEHVEVFLRALQHLCALKFAKQVLTRYKAVVDPQQQASSVYLRVLKKVAPVLVVGVLAALVAFLSDRLGFLQIFLVSYKSPFN